MSCKFCSGKWCWHCQTCGEHVSHLLENQQCETCHAKTLKGHFLCKECGKAYHPSLTGIELRPGLCFSCDFWTEKLEWSQDHEASQVALRINGQHYLVGDATGRGGFGGTPFYILTNDGRFFGTRNLWCQGVIPARFAERLPDNAIFCTYNESGGPSPFAELD